MIAAVGAAALVTAAAVVAARAVAGQWRASQAVLRLTQDEWDTPVPYWPEETLVFAVLCRACQDGEGECVLCAIRCGSPVCMGGFSDEDVAFLQSLTMPEGTDQ